MRLSRIAIATVIAGSLASFGRANEPEVKAEPKREHSVLVLRQIVADLSEENARLKRENARLSAKIRELENRPVITPPLLPPSTLRMAPSMPEGTVTREFNGQPFYLIPLKTEVKPAGTRGDATSERSEK